MQGLWKERIQAGELFKLDFLIPGRSEVRTVLLSPELHGLVYGPWENSPMGERCARLRAELENLLAGEPVTVCWTPGKARSDHQIARLDPAEDDLFDLRSVDPSPGLRVLFHFAAKDVIVTHLCSPRSVKVSWLDRVPLLDRKSKAWRNAIKESKATWSILFPGHAPHSGIKVDDYISDAVILE